MGSEISAGPGDPTGLPPAIRTKKTPHAAEERPWQLNVTAKQTQSKLHEAAKLSTHVGAQKWLEKNVGKAVR